MNRAGNGWRSTPPSAAGEGRGALFRFGDDVLRPKSVPPNAMSPTVIFDIFTNRLHETGDLTARNRGE